MIDLQAVFSFLAESAAVGSAVYLALIGLSWLDRPRPHKRHRPF